MEIEINNVKITLTKEQEDQIRKGVCATERKPEWEDLSRVKGAFVSTKSEVSEADNLPAVDANKNIFPTKEEAKACLALSQLLQWRDKYNEGWKPDWTDEVTVKYAIHIQGGSIRDFWTRTTQRLLAFKSPGIRDKFLDDFKELIEIAKPLL